MDCGKGPSPCPGQRSTSHVENDDFMAGVMYDTGFILAEKFTQETTDLKYLKSNSSFIWGDIHFKDDQIDPVIMSTRCHLMMI